ncbi:hypothetical protein [Marinobacterium stanieri]|uniref:Late embryogenesis abundant protein n=1 Tax=Marinobacterium stanieri TaxID=49186 RepID=A0A1N6QHP1_9GAMM|nr:hypothetical protein [Marinobacterium stanieri]SIQ15886.1 hypothetical protein SAMN05421647_102500 [Marinobacterium stanieri]
MHMKTLIGSTLLVSALALTGCDDSATEAEQDRAEVLEKSESSMDKLKREADETLTAAGDVYKDAKDSAQSTADDLSEKAAETGDQIREATGETYDRVKEDAKAFGEAASETAEDLTDEARTQLDELKSSDS